MIDRNNDPGIEVGNLEQTLRATLSDLASAAISPQHRDFISKDSIPEWIGVLANMRKVTMTSVNRAMKVRRIILLDVELDDFILAVRAAQFLLREFRPDAILAYGEEGQTKNFYVKRNKASVTVRPCYPPSLTMHDPK